MSEQLEEKISQHLIRNDFEKAFQVILSGYKKQLYWHIRNMLVSHDDTDDVLQETFIKIWKNLPSFKGNSKLYSWAYRIATNETLNFIEKRKRKPTDSIDGNEYLANTLTADEYFDANNAQKLLLQAVQELPEKQRLVFNMKYFQEMKYAEISEILDTSIGGLKASYHHAVKKIEAYVKLNLHKH